MKKIIPVLFFFTGLYSMTSCNSAGNKEALKVYADSSYPGLVYDKVNILSLDTLYKNRSDNAPFNYELIKDSTGKDFKFIKDIKGSYEKYYRIKELDSSDVNSIKKIFWPAPANYDFLASKCDPPLVNLVSFYKSDSLIAYIKFCFACKQAYHFPNPQYTIEEKWDDLKKLFRKNGIFVEER